MPISVTSWFIDQTANYDAEPVRKFTIGSSDYSDWVRKWPSFSRTWDQVRATNLNIELANQDKTFNFFISDKLTLTSSCSIQFGYTHPTSGDELVNFYNGTISKVSYKNGLCLLNVQDKFKQLSERVIGSQNSAQDYSGSDHLASDLAWYICTSHGGLDATKTTANVDIDYDSFEEWSGIFSGDNVVLTGRFTGQKCTDILRRIGRITRSAIYIANNKIRFKRFSLVDSLVTAFSKNELLDNDLEIDDSVVINRQYFMLNYDVSSRYHQQTVVVADSASVNSFGVREDIEKDTKVWYVNSQSAINAAERIILTRKTPYNNLEVSTTLKGLPLLIGDMIQVNEDLFDISAETYRIMSARYDLERGTCAFQINASQLNNAFILNTSSLDGADVLS